MGPVQPEPTFMDRINSVLAPGEDAEISQKQWKRGIAEDQAAMANAPQPEPMAGPAPASLMPQQAPQPENPDPFGYGQLGQDIRGGMGQINAANQAEAASIGQLGEQKAKLYEQQNQDLQKLQADTQARFDHYMQQADAVAKDALNGHISPNHYMESMSSGKKVATAIGLILGGMGGGLTGTENAAAKFLNQQIERDVQAQQADAANKQNLYSHFLRQGESVQNAANLTRAFTANIYANKIEAEGAKAASPMAKAAAQRAAGQIRMQYAPYLQQAAMHGTAMDAVKSATTPVAKIRALSISGTMPEKDKEAAMKELDKLEEVNAMKQSYLQSFDHISAKAMNGLFSPNDTESAKQAFVGKIIKATEGRYNFEAAKNLADAIFPARTDTPQTTKNKRLRGIQEFNGMAPINTLKMYGITPQQSGIYNEQGQNTLKVAKPKLPGR